MTTRCHCDIALSLVLCQWGVTMPNVAVGDKVLVTAVGILAGQVTMNTFPYRVSSVTGTVDQEAAAETMITFLKAEGNVLDALQACLPLNWSSVGIWWQVMKPVRYRKIQSAWNIAGTFEGQANTANVQASVTRVGALANRRNVGGIRIPIATSDDAVLNGLIQTALEGPLDDLCEAMKQTFATTGSVVEYVPQVGTPKGNGSYADVVDVFKQLTARVLRRRTVGLGI